VLRLKFKDIIKPLAIGLSVATSLTVINFLFFHKDKNIFYFLNFLSLFTLFLPLILKEYLKHRKVKEMEEMFHIFLRDFIQAIRSGMSLPLALKTVAENDYKSLSFYVRKMSSQLDWGIPFEKVLLNFSRQSGSKLIGRVVSSIIESHKFGGNLSDTIESLRLTAQETEKLRAERRLYIHSQLITGYIIYFVFIAVLVGLKLFLIPSLTEASEREISIMPGQQAESSISEVSPKEKGGWEEVSKRREQLIQEYDMLFRNIILIQGFFAGLSVGKMAEGALIAGIKHSLIMIFIGLIIFLLTG